MSAADGPFTVTAVMANHSTQETPNVAVAAGGTTTQNFNLRWLQPCVNTATKMLQVTMDLNTTHSETISLANAGASLGQFKIYERASEPPPAANSSPQTAGRIDRPAFQAEASRVHQNDAVGLAIPPPAPGNALAAGAVIQSWAPGANPNPWGIAYNGAGAVWVGEGWGEQHIDEYRADGTVVGRSHTYAWEPQYGPADLAFNANTGKLWAAGVGEDLNCIHEIDPEIGVTGNMICPAWMFSARGLAYDPDTDTYFGGGWNDLMVYRFTPEGTILEAINTGLPIAGLAYNPDTQHLFVMISLDPSLLLVLDTADGYIERGRFEIPGFSAYGGAGLEIDCDGNLWAVDQMANLVYQVESGEESSWCRTNVPWVAATPDHGEIAADGALPVNVTFDTRGITQPGDYYGQLRIANSNPVSGTIIIPLTLHAGQPTVQFTQAAYTIKENANEAVIGISLSMPMANSVTVEYTAGTDGSAGTGQVTFAPGELVKTFTVAVAGNPENSTIPLALRNPVNAVLGVPATATLKVLGEDLVGYGYELWANPHSPQQGMATTFGLLVHRIGGQLPRDVVVRFYLGDPGTGGVLLGTGTIPFLEPDATASTTVINWMPETAGDFQLYAVIDPDNAAPESNEQNNVVQRPFTVLPVQADAMPPVVTAFTIDGGASMTANPHVTLEVAATDLGNPASGIAGVYIVEYQWDLTLGIWKRIRSSPIWRFYPPPADARLMPQPQPSTGN